MTGELKSAGPVAGIVNCRCCKNVHNSVLQPYCTQPYTEQMHLVQHEASSHCCCCRCCRCCFQKHWCETTPCNVYDSSPRQQPKLGLFIYVLSVTDPHKSARKIMQTSTRTLHTVSSSPLSPANGSNHHIKHSKHSIVCLGCRLCFSAEPNKDGPGAGGSDMGHNGAHWTGLHGPGGTSCDDQQPHSAVAPYLLQAKALQGVPAVPSLPFLGSLCGGVSGGVEGLGRGWS